MTTIQKNIALIFALILLALMVVIIIKEPATKTITVSATRKIDSVINKPTRYFSSNEIDLPPGRVLAFAPDDNEINSWKTSPREQIYIRIIDKDSIIHINKCSYENWLNIYPGDIIK